MLSNIKQLILDEPKSLAPFRFGLFTAIPNVLNGVTPLEWSIMRYKESCDPRTNIRVDTYI